MASLTYSPPHPKNAIIPYGKGCVQELTSSYLVYNELINTDPFVPS